MKTKVTLQATKIKKKKIPKNKTLIGILISCLIINFSLISFVLIPSYSYQKEKLSQDEVKKIEEELIKDAIVIVDLKQDTTASFYSIKKVSDYIENINGTIINDYLIDTTELGSKEVEFEYINDDGIIVPYSYTINIIDDIPPQVWLNSTKSITTEYEGNLLDDITCADNIDDNPSCEIIGKYNTKVVGDYDLVFKAVDNSGNETIKKFTLKVKEPTKKNSSSSTTKSHTLFSDVIKDYKTSNTKIGIDVSSWQGDIDYEAVKNAGVEFVFIRVGSTRGINGEYFIDKKFQRNIEGFNKVGIPVGIYFYSYANSTSSAIRDANWVIEQIKKYKIDLPVVYDWESWSFYNEFNQSFYSLTQSAKAYLDTLNKAGYKGMLYSSKNYLEKVWFDTGYDVWLAHYTEQTSYKGNYKYWQLCSNGQVPGISGNVDINIYYE